MQTFKIPWHKKGNGGDNGVEDWMAGEEWRVTSNAREEWESSKKARIQEQKRGLQRPPKGKKSGRTN